ncbi:hypothetical protein KXV81_001810 [Aspergillus fumigatus]|nr:hypothetical protein KXX51_003865 [Aspergillus fumigatus]KMK56840.1 hypothetical protein Y699_05755 [Aspergillus fumigatus Z5]KAH1444974.1 hypothetical protein KXX13_005624 [Aspergillus fumigatus]KAH1477484.1 hypothetical protein KXX26_001881 [Aspergillus fumigatus]KAH1563533.1 hypothetical protein KXX28_004483 [Aspergillus fumigatus]
MEAPRVNHPRALRQKDKKAIKKKKKMAKMDSSIKTLVRLSLPLHMFDRLENAAAAEEAELARKRTKVKELLKAIKEAEEEEKGKKNKEEKKNNEGKEDRGQACALVMRFKENTTTTASR